MSADRVTERTAKEAANTAKGAVDTASSWAAEAGGSALAERLEPVAAASKKAIDAAGPMLKDGAKQAWDVAQSTTEHATEAARGGYERAQQMGAAMVQQTQDRPIIAIVTALTTGVLIGFVLSMMFRSPR